ncbi:class F sortase [Peterkaempfera bronchialis]|uniref:Class F sortase n=1 Tax=Peterkaempfera bronchialis TaxID=2126346 RepID=A0A345SUP9_9ACTN|nr:class F sortase [Peterkaempfera bronchialis]AXI77454.1 class F sortase [Peterkaempfera bronchialis]
MGIKDKVQGGPATRSTGGRDAGAGRIRLAGAAVLLGLFMIHSSLDGSSPPAPAAASPASSGPARAKAAPPSAPAGSAAPQGPAMAASAPTRLTIPAIGVNAPFTKLALDKGGVLQPPPNTDSNLVGWYGAGASPGERGTALVLGHVDTKRGPAVFWGLGALKKGSKVEITRADATTAVFTVDSVEVFPKNNFPDERVYGDTPSAQLRLITCGGTYDHKRRDYTSNVVVFAHLDSSRKR